MSIKFGTDGWRAIMAGEFTFENLKLVAQAVCNYYRNNFSSDRPLIVGHDTRFFAEEFSKIVQGVITGNGLKAIVFSRPMPTPITAFSIKSREAGGAIMLTASHNPPAYNGLKFIPDYAGPASPEITEQIEKEIKALLDGKEINYEGDLKRQSEVYDPLPDYKQALRNLVDFKRFEEIDIKIGVDPIFGAGQGILSDILKEAGAKVSSIHENRDVLFGGGLPDPSEERLNELKQLVKNKQLAVGLALDGDADRFAAIDEKGIYYSPNKIIPMIMRFLIENKKMSGKAVRTVATTHLIDAIAIENNLPLIEVPVGFKYICHEMINNNFLIGGEESGGLSIKGHIPEKDGILASLLLAEISTFHEIGSYLANIYNDYGNFRNMRIDLEIEETEKQELLRRLKEKPLGEVAGQKVTKVIDIDGFKFITESNDWLLVRPSGTEPIIRIYIESTDMDRFKDLSNYAQNLLHNVSMQ